MSRMTRFLLVIPAGLLYVAGWTAGRIANGVLWCGSAVAVGWAAARTPETLDAPLKRVA